MTSILVVGDAIIDRYWYCIPKRISPEAPILTWDVAKITDQPGGAANVAANIQALSKIFSDAVSLSFASNTTKELLTCLEKIAPASKLNKSVISAGPTTIKNRIIFEDPHQQIVRFDEDNDNPPTEEEHKHLVKNIMSGKYDVGVVSDYAHGGVTKNILSAVRQSCDLVIIDPKGTKSSNYTGLADILTPNIQELRDLTPQKLVNVSEKVKSLHHSTRGIREEYSTIILKAGAEGCYLHQYGNHPEYFKPYKTARQTIDPTGAGDTFIATLAFRIACGAKIKDAIRTANRLAGISVTHPNCWIPTEEEVIGGIFE